MLYQKQNRQGEVLGVYMPGSKLACHTSWRSSTILVIHKNTSFDHLKAKNQSFWPFSLPNPMARFFVCTGISLMMQKWDSYQPFRKWKWSNFDLQVVLHLRVDLSDCDTFLMIVCKIERAPVSINNVPIVRNLYCTLYVSKKNIIRFFSLTSRFGWPVTSEVGKPAFFRDIWLRPRNFPRYLANLWLYYKTIGQGCNTSNYS